MRIVYADMHRTIEREPFMLSDIALIAIAVILFAILQTFKTAANEIIKAEGGRGRDA